MRECVELQTHIRILTDCASLQMHVRTMKDRVELQTHIRIMTERDRTRTHVSIMTESAERNAYMNYDILCVGLHVYKLLWQSMYRACKARSFV